MKRIKLRVPQGLGDIFWIYQKFAPYFDKIDFGVCIIGDDTVQLRSFDWLKILPKVENVEALEVSTSFYQQLFRGNYNLEYVLNNYKSNPESYHDYSCNYPLENGIRIDAIDNYPIEVNVDIPIEPYHNLNYDDYIIFYISNNTIDHNFVWKVPQWIHFVKEFYRKFEIDLPLLVIGAHFDTPIMNEFVDVIVHHISVVETLVNLPPQQVCYVLKNSKFFIGYQSGLGVVADNLDVRQLMMYFPQLRQMPETWPKRQNIYNKIYNSGFFDMTPEEVLMRLPPRILNAPVKAKFF